MKEEQRLVAQFDMKLYLNAYNINGQTCLLGSFQKGLEICIYNITCKEKTKLSLVELKQDI